MQRERTMRVLGIETSCDETAAAVVSVSGHRQSGFSCDVRSNIVASQVRIHARTGGVVPEVAAREHVAQIIPVIERAVRESGDAVVGAIAVTAGPGLLSALSVGVETARSLAFAWRKPLIAVNHIEGHVCSNLLPSTRTPRLQIPDVRFPTLALIVSGGHTELLLMRRWGAYRCVGATRDDAAGEAFDKVAKLLGLAYPGGPAVAAAAERGDPTAFAIPRGMMASRDFDFSFSGMKTAVRYLVEGQQTRRAPRTRVGLRAVTHGARVVDICASFQAAVVDVLVAKTVAAAVRYRVETVLLGGGVAANHELRRQLGDAIRDHCPHSQLLMPDAAYTGDNAAMIAAAGGVRLLLGERTPWRQLAVNANWELGR